MFVIMNRSSGSVNAQNVLYWLQMTDVTQTTKRAERADSVANRDRILQAAREEFGAHGLNAEVSDIAARAGVGVGTLYRHFENRDGLLTALMQAIQADMGKGVQAAMTAGDPSSIVRELIHSMAEICHRNGALVDVLLSSRGADLKRLQSSFSEVFGGMLQQGIEQGAFRQDLDTSVATEVFRSFFAAGGSTALAANCPHAEAADAFADFFLAAIKA